MKRESQRKLAELWGDMERISRITEKHVDFGVFTYGELTHNMKYIQERLRKIKRMIDYRIKNNKR